MMATHAEAGSEVLEQAWADVVAEDVSSVPRDGLDDAIDLILDGSEVGYKKLIIVQLIGKAADFSLDAQSLQKGSGDARAWDAREFAKKVFVPWNASVGHPLGHADDPYVSNQFRNKRFDEGIREKRKNKVLFDEALRLVATAETADSAAEVRELLRKVLRGVRRQMQRGTFDYPLPARASLTAVVTCVESYLAERSGGTRLQAVVHALFSAIDTIGVPYQNLASRNVNAADTSANLPGDVSFELDGSRWSVEVKDRTLTSGQVSVSVNKARVAGVTELLFVVQTPKRIEIYESDVEEKAVREIMKREFGSGLNVYCEPFSALAQTALVILGEKGRRAFLEAVGRTLEAQKADARHRWEWARAVRAL